MSRVVKRSASQVIKISRSRRNVSSSVRSFSAFPARREATFGVTMGAWIKLVGWRMVARLDNGHAQLLTRAGLDWTGNYQKRHEPQCEDGLSYVAVGVGLTGL
jgi:ATP-dependent DNA ligase